MDSIQTLLGHPAPGLLFGVHERAGVGERVYATPHRATSPTEEGTGEVHRLCAASPRPLSDVVEVYSTWDSIGLCELRDSINDRDVFALELLPPSDWDMASEPWRTGDLASFLQDCPMYRAGTWRIVGSLPSESQSLVMFFDGEYERKPLAGRMFCIGLDGLLGFEEELAPSFGEFLRRFSADPASFFEFVGFSWYVDTERGSFGDPILAYLADVRGHPSLRPWRKV